MEGLIRLQAINESAYLEWLGDDEFAFRLTYENRFWGSCRLVGKLVHDSHRFYLDEGSVSAENVQANKGVPDLLLRIAVDFLKQKIHSNLGILKRHQKSEPNWLERRRTGLLEVTKRVRRLVFSS